MEQQFFTHEGLDQHDTLAFTYYNVTTIVDLPDVPKGSKFAVADMDYDKGKMRFWDETGIKVLHEFKLKLQVEVS